ncbi:MAG: glycoside hydrolase family 5 protein, partial [Lachnospiraceae bacterium]|nr:glycoside hydrolase family 5 protein [Lachnospiraceae bacterium]
MKQRTASKQPDACTRKRPAPRAGTKAGLKTFRRALALTLALCLTLGLIPTGILPEGIDSDFKIEAQAAAPLDSAARAELTNPATNGSWDTPYEKYGELSLKVDEEGDGYNKLWSEKAGEFVQLKGMSTFGLMFDDNGDSAAYKSEGTWALTPEVFDIMAYDWEIDFIRVAMYVTEGGTGVYAQLYNDVNKNYESDPPVAISDPTGRPDIALRRVLKAIDLAVERGLYVMVDWHVLNPGDPNHPDYLAAGTGKKMGKNGLEAFTGAESSAVDWNSKGAGLEAADGGVDVSDFDDFRATTDNNTYGYPAPASMNGPQLFFAYLANRYYERKIEADPSGYGDYTADTLPRASGATELMGSKPLQGKGQIMWEIANEPNLRDWNIETHSRPAEEGGCNAWQRFDSGGLNAHSMGYSWQNIMACNWQNRLLPYMDRVTETIRRFDLNGIIIAGTDNWCQYVDAAVMAKTTMSDYGAGSFVTDPRARRTGDFNNPYDAAKSRVMYTVHFYAGTHDIGYDYDTRSGSQFYPNSDGGNGYSESFNDYGPLGPAPAGTTGAYWLRQKIDNALEGGMALFCTEWGVSGASGDYGPYLDFSERWLDYLAEKGISWSAWSLARKNETSSVTKFSTPNGGTPNAAFLQKRVKSLGGKEYDVPYWAMEDEYQTGFTGTKTDQLSVAGQYIRAKILGDPRALEKYSGGDISRQ